MQWPDLDAAFNQVTLPVGYRYSPLRRIDISVLRAAVAEWHPDVSVGAASCYLEQDFYESTATIAESLLPGGRGAQAVAIEAASPRVR